jgi:hypothetical protein
MSFQKPVMEQHVSSSAYIPAEGEGSLKQLKCSRRFPFLLQFKNSMRIIPMTRPLDHPTLQRGCFIVSQYTNLRLSTDIKFVDYLVHGARCSTGDQFVLPVVGLSANPKRQLVCWGQLNPHRR